MNVVKNFLQQQMVRQRLLGELPIVRRTSDTAFHSRCCSDVHVLLGIAPLLCCQRLQFADSHIADRAAIDTSAVRISAHRRVRQPGVHPSISWRNDATSAAPVRGSNGCTTCFGPPHQIRETLQIITALTYSGIKHLNETWHKESHRNTDAPGYFSDKVEIFDAI